MMRIPSCLLVLATVALAGCSSLTVNQDFDPDYNFAAMKTFNFFEPSADSGLDGITLKRVQSAVQKEMTARGYTQAEDSDIGIAAHGGMKTETSVESYGYGYGMGWGGMGGGVEVDQYDVGTLVIDFVDMKQKALVWRGTASGIVGDASPEQKTERVNNAVAQMIAQFPPTSAK